MSIFAKVFGIKKTEDTVEEKTDSFEEMIKDYSPSKLNALFYQMVNHCRDNPEKRHLLYRWQERLTKCLSHMPY